MPKVCLSMCDLLVDTRHQGVNHVVNLEVYATFFTPVLTNPLCEIVSFFWHNWLTVKKERVDNLVYWKKVPKIFVLRRYCQTPQEVLPLVVVDKFSLVLSTNFILQIHHAVKSFHLQIWFLIKIDSTSESDWHVRLCSLGDLVHWGAGPVYWYHCKFGVER